MEVEEGGLVSPLEEMAPSGPEVGRFMNVGSGDERESVLPMVEDMSGGVVVDCVSCNRECLEVWVGGVGRSVGRC